MAKLLIVDDDRNIRETLAIFFRIGGHRVRAVENGQAAVALLAEESYFDLVLSDWRMDKINGPRTAPANQAIGSKDFLRIDDRLWEYRERD